MSVPVNRSLSKLEDTLDSDLNRAIFRLTSQKKGLVIGETQQWKAVKKQTYTELTDHNVALMMFNDGFPLLLFAN